MVVTGRAGREERRSPAGEGLRGLEAQVEADRAPAEPFRRGRHVRAHRQDEVGDQRAVRVQPTPRGRARPGSSRRSRSAESRRRCRRRRRSRAAARRRASAPSSTFEANVAPARPPPERRQPIVGTPASAAVSRWSEAACRPARDRARSSSTPGGASISSGSGGPPRPIATTTTSRSRASERATCPVTAVFPTRLPGPDHGERRQRERLERRRVEAEVGADVGQPSGERVRGEPEAGRRVHARARRTGRRRPPARAAARPSSMLATSGTP